MDPLTLAGTFATLVGLLTNFKSERKGEDLAAFTDWLRAQHQESLAQAIVSNRQLEVALGNLLGTNHEELVARLTRITDLLADVAKGVEGFSEVVQLTYPRQTLSAQARAVLRQIASSSARYVMEHKTVAKGREFLFMDGASGTVQAEEPRFLEEDMDALVAAGLVRVDRTTQGTRRFYVTRHGMKLGRDV
ncbi:hypothetical protein [Ramlibacter pallidus]|uniref:Uncharacterized protein n=1 Tax=Ramlibacter pallidus TaxID=2780087 RepID=A0ABR9S3E2_9BURK|nr:hypothetical protein [Ramlibacter pallidus]MBE7368022.1 hypothetical protein [Ramlibacter pallidus]